MNCCRHDGPQPATIRGGYDLRGHTSVLSVASSRPGVENTWIFVEQQLRADLAWAM